MSSHAFFVPVIVVTPLEFQSSFPTLKHKQVMDEMNLHLSNIRKPPQQWGAYTSTYSPFLTASVYIPAVSLCWSVRPCVVNTRGPLAPLHLMCPISRRLHFSRRSRAVFLGAGHSWPAGDPWPMSQTWGTSRLGFEPVSLVCQPSRVVC